MRDIWVFCSAWLIRDLPGATQSLNSPHSNKLPPTRMMSWDNCFSLDFHRKTDFNFMTSNRTTPCPCPWSSTEIIFEDWNNICRKFLGAGNFWWFVEKLLGGKDELLGEIFGVWGDILSGGETEIFWISSWNCSDFFLNFLDFFLKVFEFLSDFLGFLPEFFWSSSWFCLDTEF